MYLNFSGSKTDAKTWFIDLDGVLAMHNQYKSGNDELIEGFNALIKQNKTLLWVDLYNLVYLNQLKL